MSLKYKNQYRVASTRLQNWDYGWNAAYFITVCSDGKVHCFGRISNRKMRLSPIGIIADLMWYEIVKHAKNVVLGEFVVMPNHIHGIIILDDTQGDDTQGIVETRHALSLQQQQQQQQQPKKTPNTGQNRFQNQGKNTISSIVGSYKSAVTKHAHRLGFDFAWQSRFYDHIIRNEQSFHKISNYIINNPTKWSEDRFYKRT